MGRALRDLALAITLLTCVPLPVSVRPGERTRTSGWFALVGLVIGVALVGVSWVAFRFFYGMSGLVAALLLVGVAAFTRMLHYDGLADVADAWWSPRERRLDIMADSHTGAFGATAVSLVVLIQWSALVDMASSRQTVALVVLVPLIGRLAATASAWLGTPARPSGLGASVLGKPDFAGALATTVALAAGFGIALFLGAPVLLLEVVGVFGILAALAVPHVIALHFDGVTGDTMGASVLVTEALVMIVAVTAASALRLTGVM